MAYFWCNTVTFEILYFFRFRALFIWPSCVYGICRILKRYVLCFNRYITCPIRVCIISLANFSIKKVSCNKIVYFLNDFLKWPGKMTQRKLANGVIVLHASTVFLVIKFWQNVVSWEILWCWSMKKGVRRTCPKWQCPIRRTGVILMWLKVPNLIKFHSVALGPLS
jgi:hypothetical protein